MPQTPEYAIRESRRARHVRLSMSIHEGLVVTVPHGFDHRRIPEILAEKVSWIRKHTRQMEGQRQQHRIEPPDALPDRIELPAMGRSWSVRYGTTPGARRSVRETDVDQLMVITSSNRTSDQHDALRTWLLRQGRAHLKPALLRRAADYAFDVKRVRIGCQKGRWGSCSSRGTVSLNAKLLFLPPEWVHYVLMHELCHTKEMNHSARFWHLLERHVPDARGVRKELRDAWIQIPAWSVRRFPSES